MTALSALKVLELNSKYNLIENLCERERKNPEGIEMDIRVGSVYKQGEGRFYLGVNERESPKAIKIADIQENGEGHLVTMKPGDYYLVKTIERINFPKEKIEIEKGKPLVYLTPKIYARKSLQDAGVALLCTTTNPGYFGNLGFGIKNLSNYNLLEDFNDSLLKLIDPGNGGIIEKELSSLLLEMSESAGEGFCLLKKRYI